MAINPEMQRVMLHLATIISTAYECDLGKMPTPQGPMFLAFNQQGYDIHHFNNLITIGEKIGYWTATSETITLTGLGICKAKKFKEIEIAHNQ
jgi:hypothetical protein